MTKQWLMTVALSILFATTAAMSNESAAGANAVENTARSPTFRGSRNLQEGDDSGYAEAGDKTTVTAIATAYDDRPGEESDMNGCGQDGCMPALAHDGIREDVESRWSCCEEIVPEGGQCEIEFIFDSPQDVKDILVDFWKGEERSRTLKVLINGETVGMFESQPGSVTTSLGIERDGVQTVTLESMGLDKDEWLSLIEVRFNVEA